MADATDNLEIRVTADEGQAQTGINDLVTVLTRLSLQLDANAAAGTKSGAAMAQAHAIAAGAAVRQVESETLLGTTIGRVETATNSAARALGALGIRSGEAAERVLAVTEAMEGLQKAALPLVAVGGAFLAVGEAALFVKESIADAAREQREFTSLAVAVGDQKQSWNEARESIENFATKLQEATTFSRGEAITAINDLVTAGVRYADAEKIVAVATDVAAAKHMSLIDVTDLIKQAEAGRAMGLVRLDENLKKVAESHGHLSEVVRILSNDFSGQAANATETLEGKQARLRNELELIGTEIGTLLLPALERGTDFFLGMAKAAEQAGESIADTGRVIGDVGKTVAEFFQDGGTPEWGPKNKAILDDMGKWRDASSVAGNRAVEDLNHPFRAAKPDTDAWNKLQKQLDASSWENDPILGRDPKPKREKKPKAEQAPVNFEMIGDDDASKTDAVVAAQKTLDDQLKALTASENQYKLAVELATTSDQKASAEAALRNKISADAAEASVRLGLQIAKEKDEIVLLSAQHIAAAASAKKLGEEHDQLAKVLDETQNRSAVARARVEELKKEHDAAAKSASSLASSIATLTSQMNTNSDALSRQPALAEANARAQAALMLAYNDSRKAESEKLAVQLATNGQSLEQELAYWQSRIAALNKGSADYLAQLAKFQNSVDETNAKIAERNTKDDREDADARQKLADEEATYKLSLAQQIAYYSQRYAQTVAADGQYSDEARKVAEQIRTLELDEYKQRADEHQKFLDEFKTAENSIVDDIIGKHQSMRDTLKDIWKDIVGNWTSMIEQMIEKSALMQGLDKSILGIFGGGGGDAATAGGVAGVTGIGSAAAGGGSLLGLLSPLVGTGGSQQQGLPTQLTDDSISKLTGSSSGVLGAGSTYSGSNPALAPYTDASPGAHSYGAAATSADISGGVSGAAIGSIVSGIDGGNSTYGSLGGALGGIAGAVTAANPIAGLGLEVGGSLLGSLFGPKNQNAYGMPDVYDTTRYGTTIADLTGQAGANGQTFYEDSGTKSAFGGATGLAGVEQLLATGASSFESSTGLSAAQYAQAVKMFGDSSSGSGTLNFDKNIGTEYVTGAAGASGQYRYTDFGSMLSQIEAGLSAKGGTNAFPEFSVSRTYANPNLTSLKSDGTYLATKDNLLNGGTQNTYGATATTTPTVTVNITGNVVGPGGIEGVANDIGIAIKRAASGQVTGGSNGTRSLNRFTGGS